MGKKLKLLRFVFAVLFLLPVCVNATTTYFTSDANIQAGDTFSTVIIHDTPPAHTTINMTGGSVTDNMYIHDAATFNMSAGQVRSWVAAYDQSTANITGGLSWASVTNNATVNISSNASVGMASTSGSGIFNVYGGTISQLTNWQTSTVNVYGGNISNSVLVYDTGVVNVYGGIIGYLSGSDSSVFNLRGGLITSYLAAGSSAAINVFGYDLAKTDTGGMYGYGQITGFWQDSSQFTIDLNYSGTYSAVNLIPEPTTFLLLSIGAFLLRKSKNRIQKS